MKDFFFLTFTSNSNLCPVNGLKVYTKEWRDSGDQKSHTHTSYHATIAATIARLIKAGLTKAGNDTSILKAHFVCSAVTSAAADAGMFISEIMEAADWSSASMVEKFYYCPHKSTQYDNCMRRMR